MQYKYKVSIIVPCYNVEPWINQCIESLVNQTLQQIEIICIDDGSNDNTAAKLDAWQAKYPNKIQVIHQVNSGQSVARNIGINIAQGKYIGFVDADDWVDITMFAKLYSSAISNQAEAVHCGRYLYNQQTKKLISKKWQLPQHKLSKNKTLLYLQQYANGREGVCFFIFSKKFLQQYNIDFIKQFTTFEDFPFLVKVCQHADKIIHINQPLYYYRQNHTNIRISKSQDKQVFIFIQIFTYIKKLLTTNNSLEVINHITMVQILTHIYACKNINKSLAYKYLLQSSNDIFSFNNKKNIYRQAWLLTRYKNIIYFPFVVLLNILYLLKKNFCHK